MRRRLCDDKEPYTYPIINDVSGGTAVLISNSKTLVLPKVFLFEVLDSANLNVMTYLLQQQGPKTMYVRQIIPITKRTAPTHC